MNRILRFTVALLFTGSSLFSQESAYYIQNYEFADLSVPSNMSYSVVEDTLGLILSTSANSLLYFDGQEWLIRNFNNEFFNTLFRDSEGGIWYGSIHSFGRVIMSESHGIDLEPFSTLLPDSLQLFGAVTSITEYDSSYFFHSYPYIFRLKGEEITLIENSSKFPIGFIINGSYYTCNNQYGLLKYESGSFTQVRGGEQFTDRVVVGMAALSADSLIIGTRTDGIYLLSPSTGRARSWPGRQSEIGQILESIRLQHLAGLPGNTIALSTTEAGTIIINSDGKISRKLDKSTGTSSNRHINTFLGRSDRLWMCTDHGLSSYALDSPFYIWGASQGIEGNITSLTSSENRILISSFRGLFALRKPLDPDGRVDQLLNIPCWNISDATLNGGEEVKFICSQDGLFLYRNHQISLIFPGNVYRVIQLNRDNKFFVAVGLSGLHAFTMNERKTGLYQMNRYLFTDIKSLVQDNEYFWITYGSAGTVFRLSQKELIERLRDGELDRLEYLEVSTSHPMLAFNISKDKYIFSSAEGFLEYEAASNSLVKLRSLGNDVENFPGIVNNMSRDLNGNIWLGGSRILLNNYDGTYKLSRVNLEVLSGRTGSYDIYHNNDGSTWIADERGVILIDRLVPLLSDMQRVIITRIVMPDSTVRYHYNSGNSTNAYTILSHKRAGEISIYYTLPYNVNANAIQYSWQMDGYNDSWSRWSSNNHVSFKRLKPGRFTFRVRARNDNGMESEVSSIDLVMGRAWYKTVPVKIVILITVLLAAYRVVRLTKRARNKIELQIEEQISRRINESFITRLIDRLKSEKPATTNGGPQQADIVIAATRDHELFIEKFTRMVEKHLSDSELSVESLASLLNVSQKTLYRRVKDATGLSVRSFIRKARLSKAAILLANYDISVAEAAFKVGYNDPSYFSRSFRDQFKATPLQFQKEARARHKERESD